MKTSNYLTKAFLTLLITVPQLLLASPWESRLNNEQRTFSTQQLDPVLKLYEEGKEEEALEELDRAYDRAEAAYAFNPQDRVHFFHRIIWWEAQVRSGRDDPNWGYQLYAYLYNRDVLKAGSVKIIPPSEYILIGNIMAYLEETGKAAETRAWVLHLEDNICTYRGLNTTNTMVYANQGPIFSFMPEACKRTFPLFRHEVPELKTCSCNDHAIYYPYLYAIHYIADNALKSGDWARAAELYLWYLSYTDRYIAAEKNEKRNEIFRGNLQVINSLATICTIHGHPEEIIAMYENAIEQINEHRLAQNGTLEVARLYKEASKIKLGTISEEAILVADQAVDTLSSIHFYSHSQLIQFQLVRARIYHALGHKEEAWEFVNELLETTKEDINPYLWTYLLTTMIDLAIDDGATHPELENWLIMALNNERLQGNKFGELPLYEKYAILLLQQGRYAEAIQIQQEALRLAKAMNLHERAIQNQTILDHIKSLQTPPPKKQSDEAHTTSKPETPPPQPTKTAAAAVAAPAPTPALTSGGVSTTQQRTGIDIQPYQSGAISLAGQAAYGRFYLFNPTTETKNGTLRFSGAVGGTEWLTDNWLMIGSSHDFSISTKEEPLIIPAGSCCLVDLTGIPDPSGKATTITCEWLPDNAQQLPSSAEWEYRTAPTDQRTAVIDAHVISENPFYLIPIHHMVQRAETSEAETLDFSVESSVPMRIEIYNGETDELVSIDANGDGDFKDTGDFIGCDANRNNWPDIGFKVDQKLTSLVMYIKPIARGEKNEAELTVKILDENEWRIDAIDLIHFAK